MVEKTVEEKFRKRVKDAGGWALKFVSPGTRGVPDRLVLTPVPEEHRELVARYVYFCELKRPGGRLSPAQKNVHARLRRMGFTVEVLDG